MNREKEHWLVLGLGVSGLSAARLLLGEGKRVSVLTGRGGAGSHSAAQASAPDGVEVFCEQEDVPWKALSGAVLSPGIPFDHSWLEELRRRGVPMVPECELGWSRFTGRTVAVSGSNGKSTFVKWCVETLRAEGVDAVACGNYGVPVCDCAVQRKPPGLLVMELSSFQLEATVRFAPDAAVLLNVLPNHLDRHGTMERYTRIKLKLFERMNREAPAVLPFALNATDGPRCATRNRITFGWEEGADYRVCGRQVLKGGEPVGDLTGTLYGNRVTAPTGAACAAWMDAMRIPRATGWKVLRTLEPLPHRQETVAIIRGVRFVNDSKATNLAALGAAVEAFGPGVRLIAGGQAKEKDFKSAKEMLARNTGRVYLIGRDAEKMALDWAPEVQCCCCQNLECAVQTAWQDAVKGETVLLSPGCTSYDQFNNFEERGKAFAKAVKHLEMEEEHEKSV